jgi:hypothetical protein
VKYRLALVALLALGACHRRTSEVMPGADAEARRAAAQQTSGDLAAAADAAQGQAVTIAPRAAARPRPVWLMPDATAETAPRLPVAENVSQDDAPAQPN